MEAVAAGAGKLIRKLLFKLNLLLSGCIIGLAAWTLTAMVKDLVLDHYRIPFNAWAKFFYHPHDAAVMNYVATCVCLSILGLRPYFQSGNRLRYLLARRRTLGNRFPLLLIPCLLLFPVLLNRHWHLSHRFFFSLGLAVILCVPFKSGRFIELCKSRVRRGDLGRDRLLSLFKGTAPRKRKLLVLLSLSVWCLLAVEPARVVIGPVSVLNEFKELYSETRVGNGYVNNETFLRSHDQGDAEADAMVRANELEYQHQNNTRGQLHHMGHLLNPLNEYASGKPLPDVYMQYGWGNTLLYQLTMDLFGGASVQNYYKCYLYYILYSVLFAGLLLYLFRDTLFFFYGTLFYAICFYATSYLVFMLAPGIIPTIHLLDAPVLLLMTLYFRRGRPGWLLPPVLLSALAIYMNRQFGLVLVLSVTAAGLIHLWENRRGRERYLPASALALLPVILLAAPFLRPPANTSSTLLYFLTGFLSFEPRPVMVYLTILYLVVCFHFLFRIRKKTHPLKYAFVFSFVYSLGLLTYFYWSGLANHLAPVLPFAGLSLLLMLYLAKELLLQSGRARALLAPALTAGAVCLACIFGSTLFAFYKGKLAYDQNFRQHRVYRWDFPRARIVTTANPEPIRQTIDLIHKYSPERHSGIYLISVYDKVLPFLAERYSLMPFFEMQWYLFTPKERAAAIERLLRGKPQYLFVDNDLTEMHEDPWADFFNDHSSNRERESSEERRLEVGRIFQAVQDDYQKVEQGPLLSVWRRRSVDPSAAALR